MPEKTPDDAVPSFEASLARLEEVVRQLEDGQLGLADSLASYEDGIRYLKQCHAALAVAERKISLLKSVDEGGQAEIEEFDDGAMNLEAKKEARSRRRSRPSAPPQGDGDVDTQKGLF